MAYHCSLSTPQRTFFHAHADKVEIAGVRGDFVAMEGHGLLLTSLRRGMIRIHPAGGGDVLVYGVDGEGYAHVARHACIVMAQSITEASV